MGSYIKAWNFFFFVLFNTIFHESLLTSAVGGEQFEPCTFESCPQCLASPQQAIEFQSGELQNMSLKFAGREYRTPLRIGFVRQWSSSELFASMIGILINEALGVAVEYVECEHFYSCALALLGCTGWGEATCALASSVEDSLAAYHNGTKRFPDALADVMIFPDMWDEVLQKAIEAKEQREESEQKPDAVSQPQGAGSQDHHHHHHHDAGASGFVTEDGLFIKHVDVARAWKDAGLDLTSYRMLLLPEAKDHLDTPAKLIASKVEPEIPSCSSGAFLGGPRMEMLQEYGWTCREYWWLSPSCAATGINWKQECLAVLSRWAYLSDAMAKRVGQLELRFAFMMADLDELHINSSTIVNMYLPNGRFEAYVPERINLGWSAEVEQIAPKKIGWQPMMSVDGRVSMLLAKMNLSPTAMRQLTQRTSEAVQAGFVTTKDFYRRLACQWLRNHTEDVEEWLEGGLRCLLGEGYDVKQEHCSKCQPGTVYRVDESGRQTCVPCPAGSTSSRESSVWCDCCQDGTYNLLENQTQCAQCPEGSLCERSELGCFNENSTAMFQLAEGFGLFNSAGSVLQAWRTAATAQKVMHEHGTRPFNKTGPFRCPVQAACLKGNSCVEGMGGPLCGSCRRGFARNKPTEQCNLCGPVVENGLVSLLIGVCIILVAFAMDRLNKVSQGSRDVSSVVPKILSTLFIQIGVAVEQLDITSKSDQVQQFLAPLKLGGQAGDIVQDPSSVNYSLKCYLQHVNLAGVRDAYLKVVLGWMLIPATFVVVFLLCLLVGLRGRTKSHAVHKRSVWHHAVHMWKPKAIVLAYLLHPPVTKMFLETFLCLGMDSEGLEPWDHYRLLMDTEIICSDLSHIKWMIVAGLGILTYSFGIPFYLYLSLRRILSSGSESLASRHVRRTHGFLYVGFEPSCYYYESNFMIRKVTILMFSVQMLTQSHTRTVILAIITLFFFASDLHFEPFDNRAYKSLDRLQTLSGSSLLAMYGTGILLTGTPNASSLQLIAYIPTVALLFYTLAFAVYLMVRNLLWPLEGESPLPACIVAQYGGRMHLTLVPISQTESCQQCMDLTAERQASMQQDGHPLRKQVTSKFSHHKQAASKAAAKANPLRKQVTSKFSHHRPTASAALLAEHVLVGHCCHSHAGRHLEEELEPSPRERMLLKDFFTSLLDVLLDRQVFFADRPVSVVSLPSLMLQLERMCIACTLHALKKRVKAAKALKEASDRASGYEVDHLKDQVKGGLDYLHSEATTIFTGHRSEEQDESEISLVGVDRSLIFKPVSVEEMHLSMYELMPKVTDTQNDDSGNFLAKMVHNNKHLIDMVSHVSWLFKPEAHSQVAGARSASFESLAEAPHEAVAVWDSDGFGSPDQPQPRCRRWADRGLQPFEDQIETQEQRLQECGSLCFAPPQPTAPQVPVVFGAEASRSVFCGCIPASEAGAQDAQGPAPAPMLKL